MSLFTVIAVQVAFLARGQFAVEPYGLRFIPAAIARRRSFWRQRRGAKGLWHLVQQFSGTFPQG
jgi:hypothetical protein